MPSAMASYHDSSAEFKPWTTEIVTVAVTASRVRSHVKVPRHFSSCPPAAYNLSVGGDRLVMSIRRASAWVTPMQEVSAPVSGVHSDVPDPPLWVIRSRTLGVRRDASPLIQMSDTKSALTRDRCGSCCRDRDRRPP